MSNGTLAMGLMACAIEHARKLGVSTDDLLLELDLSAGTLADPDARIPFETGIRLWDELARRAHAPDFGAQIALALPPGYFDLHEYLTRCSPTLGAGFRRVCRFIRLLSTQGHMEVELTPREMRIVNRPPTRSSAHFQEFSMCTVLLIARRAAASPLTAIRVELMHSELADTKKLRALFACPIFFDKPCNMVVFPRAFDALPMPAHDERLVALIERHAQVINAALDDDRSSLADRVRRSLSRLVHQGDVTLEKVARTVGMSGRSLQRELRNESHSFRDLVDEARREVAISHMREGRLAITTIAALLDFSDVSAFHRSFRRWTGKAPAAFRAAAKADATVSIA
jgi:AraC-like DNA-binding protein